MSRPVRLLLLPAVLLAVALTGCSGSGGPVAAPGTTPAAATSAATTSAVASTTTTTSAARELDRLPVEQALARARKAFLAAPYAHVSGTIKERSGTTTITVDLLGSRAGKGTMKTGKGTFTVIRVNSKTYITGDRTFLTGVAGAKAAKLLKGKYLRVAPGDPDIAGMTDLVTPAGLAGMLPTRDLIRGPAGPAVLSFVDDADGSYQVGGTGAPLPLRLKGTDSGSVVDLTFSYDHPITISDPPKSKVVSIPAS